MAAGHFGHDTSRWQAGRRVDDASRAVAACLARRCYGYSAKAVAATFGYRGHGGVHTAPLHIEDGTTQLRQTVNHLAKTLDKRRTARCPQKNSFSADRRREELTFDVQSD